MGGWSIRTFFASQLCVRGWALVGVLVGLILTLLLAALDQTIVGTALPRIIGDLQGFDRYSWVVTAYLLGSTMMIPIGGKLSDQFGRKWFLMAGIVLFLGGSALSGASQTMNQLIVFRGLQGVGGGFLQALVITLVGDIFPPAERARWQGVFGAVFALASVIGPGRRRLDHRPCQLALGFLCEFAVRRAVPACACTLAPRQYLGAQHVRARPGSSTAH